MGLTLFEQVQEFLSAPFGQGEVEHEEEEQEEHGSPRQCQQEGEHLRTVPCEVEDRQDGHTHSCFPGILPSRKGAGLGVSNLLI